jgi:hypothetical protein
LNSSPDGKIFIITDKQKQQGSKFQAGTSLFQGFSKGKSQRQQQRYDKENSKTNLQIIVSASPPDYGPSKDVKYQGFIKGKTKLGKMFYFKEASKEQSGLVIAVEKREINTKIEDNLTLRVLNKRAQRQFDKDASRAFSQWEGVRVPSYQEQIKDFRNHASKTAKYGRRYASPVHPMELLRKVNVYWLKITSDKMIPASVRDTPKKPKFDKSEKDLWNY